jgi:hypothetical protein
MPPLLALLLAMTPAINSTDHDCAGGAVIFFAPGSDRLGPYEMGRLASYADGSRRQNADSQIYIESGGSGGGAAFDRSLSRRRSEQIWAFLVARGLRPDRIHIEVSELYAGLPAEANSPDPYEYRIGHVYELVSREEYRRLYPPDMVVECF